MYTGAEFIWVVDQCNTTPFNYGDILCVNRILNLESNDIDKLPYSCAAGNNKVRQWWFDNLSLKLTCVPIEFLKPKDLFIYQLSGSLPTVDYLPSYNNDYFNMSVSVYNDCITYGGEYLSSIQLAKVTKVFKQKGIEELYDRNV